MKNAKKLLALLFCIIAITAITALVCSAAEEPAVVATENYTVTISGVVDVKEIRFAPGHWTTGAEVKAADGNLTLSASLVAQNTDGDGVFTYEVAKMGEYTFWVRMNDGSDYFLYADTSVIESYLTAYGVKLTVNDFRDDYNDIWIAEGEWTSYRELKENAPFYMQLSQNKLATKFYDHDYTYTCHNPGVHTVLYRYTDGSVEFKYITLEVDITLFDENNLQVTVNNIPDIKIIRVAPGQWTTASEVKGAQGVRNFSNKTAIKDAESYKVQFREEGWVTFIVEYNNGYQHVHQYYVEQKIPTMVQEGNSVTFGNLEDLQVLRYAPGKYTTGSAIKNAEGVVSLKSEDIDENGNITISNLTSGRWSFLVQYTDESHNFYLITVEEVVEECVHSWGEWVVTTPATEEAEGLETRTCTLCGATETNVIPKLEPAAVPTATNVHVSCAFNDNMILQRDEKLSVWGTATPSSGDVVVSFAGETASASVDAQGNWKAVFDKTFAYTTEGQDLTVSGGDASIVLNDVLIGDVYYIIGQSNVFYSMGELILDLKLLGRSDQLTVDYDDRRDIRFFRISSTDYMNMTGAVAQGTTTLYNDVYNGGYWMKPTDVAKQIIQYANFTPTSQLYSRDAISMEVFSAIGYMFAYNMSEKTDVPCGVIEIDASGHPLITFAPNELADKWGHDALDASGRYYYKLNDSVMNTNLRSRYAYNQQIYPLSNFSCAGIIWYQGESDMYNTREAFGADYKNGFANQFAELMTYFRSTFGNDDFAVYMFEYPACYYNNGSNAFMDFGAVRTEVGTIPQILSDCHIVSSSDLFWDTTWWNNIHPPIKHLNAIRLAEIVAADKFGIGSLDDVCGPVLNDVVYDGTKATLIFDHAGSGLTTADGSANVMGIEIMVNNNGSYQWIACEGDIISGVNEITVDGGSYEIMAVRYGRDPEATHPFVRNLCNAYLMPAVAFVDYK